MATKKSTESVRRQAQEIAYRAMSARDPEEALALCMKAIDTDPHCVDALTMAAGVFEPEERIGRLAGVVKMAEKDLGGESYFQENKGHFWGILETRPYMRARTYLAQTLAEAGKIEAAIAEYEALLDLNPGDNQGLRYVLMGLYLETDDLGGVRRLFDEYEGEHSAVFAWSKVLERLISEDMEDAERSLAEAREVNPYVEGYLLQRKPMPAELPDHYGFGDENEAIMYVDVIGLAWKKHPEAIRWLRLHESNFSAAPSVKVGRNEPCPCGSGKKYKKCCLGKGESSPAVSGNRFAAEMALRDIHHEMEGREFSSVEEMNAFIQEYNRQQNRKLIDDFEGLSAEQMHRLINFPFESPDVVEFPSLLDTEPSAPIVLMFSRLADAIGEGRLKPTAKGNLPLKVVREIAHACLGAAGYAEFTRYGDIRSEEDYTDLHVTRIVAELAGLIRKYKGRFILGRECRKLLKDGGMRAIYPILFRTFAEKLNWGYADRYPEVGFVQNFFSYTLYLLTRHGQEWHETTFYEDAFLRAFPSVLDTIEPSAYEAREILIRGMYSLRSFERFAKPLGLVEIDKTSEDRYSRVFKLKATALLGDAVRFHI